jgi:hypothetical protein
MRIDEHDFEYTAKAVYIMNVSVRESYDSWEDLREFMISMAYTYCHESTSFSTSGFNLTAYASPDGKERVVRASVMGYVACQFAERTQRIKELARIL